MELGKKFSVKVKSKIFGAEMKTSKKDGHCYNVLTYKFGNDVVTDMTTLTTDEINKLDENKTYELTVAITRGRFTNFLVEGVKETQ